MVISPAGRQLDFVKCPDPQTTNICFGGADLCTAFVTLGGIGELVSLSWPRPGLPLNFLNRQAGCGGQGVLMADKGSD
jgi:gluconolactonase